MLSYLDALKQQSTKPINVMNFMLQPKKDGG